MYSPHSCHSHRVAQEKSSTHCSLSVFFSMYHVASVSPLYRSATIVFFFSRHHVAQSKSPRHTALSVVDRIFFSHATSWKRAKVINTLLYWSSTEFWSFPRHLVAQCKCPPAAHCSIGPRATFYLFHATSWHTKRLCVTQHSIVSRPKPFL